MTALETSEVRLLGPRSTAGRRPARDDQDRLAELLARAATGDTAAFMTFYDLTLEVAYRYARATAGPDRADEATRATYLRAWSDAGDQARSGLSPLAWLVSVARTAGTPAADRSPEVRAS